METITVGALAAEHHMQPYEVAALFDLGRDWTTDMELDVVEAREIMAAADEAAPAE